jgi:hypothetical protein
MFVRWKVVFLYRLFLYRRAETCREYRGYIIKYFVNCCEKEGIIYS